MPIPGAGPSWQDALPPPGDSASWSEADWQWDPVAMTATALPHVGRTVAGASGPSPPQDPARQPAPPLQQHPAGCSGMGGVLEDFICEVMHAGGGIEGAGATLPPAGPDTLASSDGSVPPGLGGSGAATTAEPSGTHGRGARQRKGKAGGAAASGPAPACQADGCGADLSSHTYYHQRNKICMVHIKADMFARDGEQLRFCQRCGHAHPLPEFDPGKHSCRKQLERHNARRRKRQQGAGASDDADLSPVPQQAQQEAAQHPQQGGQRAKRSRGKASPPTVQPQQAADAVAADVMPAGAALDAFAAAAKSAAAAATAAVDVSAVYPAQLPSQPQAEQVQLAAPLFFGTPRSSDTSASGSAPASASPPLLPQQAQQAQAQQQAQQVLEQGQLAQQALEQAQQTVQQAQQAQQQAQRAPVAAAPMSLPQPLQRQPSPPLLLLDFDLDQLRPTPYEELFYEPPAPLQRGDTVLAEEMAAWLNSSLSQDAEPQPPQQLPQQQRRQQVWHAAASGAPPALAVGSACLQQHPQHLGSSLQVAQGIMHHQLLPLDPSLFGALPPASQQQQGHGGMMLHASAPMQQAVQQHAQHLPACSAGGVMHPLVAEGIPASAPQQAQQQQVQLHAQQQQQQQQAQQHASSANMGVALPAASSATQAPGTSTGAAATGSASAAAATSRQSPQPTLATVSVKLFGCTPAELPSGLRDHLKGWFEGAVNSLDGYLRPGCVHLTVQALLEGMLAAAHEQAAAAGEGEDGAAVPQAAAQQQAYPASAEARPAGAAIGEAQAAPRAPKACCQPSPKPATEGSNPPAAVAPGAAACCGQKRAASGAAPEPTDRAVRRVVERMLQSGEALWRTKTMLVQAGSHVALVHRGRLQKTWDIEGAPAARAVPAILEVSPPLLLASQPDMLRVSGLNMLQNDCQLLLRLQGRYVQPAAALCAECSCQASVHPASGADVACHTGAAAAATSFEQRCCGCCTSKLQLVGLAPRPCASGSPALEANARPAVVPAGPTVPAAVTTTTLAAAPTKADAPASCCQPAAAAPPVCCGASQERQQGGTASGPAAAAASGRRVVAAAARMQSLRLLLPSQQMQQAAGQPLLPGLLHLDICRRAYTAPRGARVLVVSSPAVHAELCQLVEAGGAGALPQPLLDQLGVVHEWLGRPEKMQYPLVEATAARLLFWAVSRGLPATAALLLSVLQAQGGSSAAAAASVLQRALQPDVVGSTAAAAVGRLDGLSQLHLSMQATSAAAMQRAGELAGRDGMSLLHRGAQSGSLPTLQALLEWGEEAGSPWRCDLAGPAGLSPLHLAALLPSPRSARQAVLLLLGRCSPGARGWDCCCAADGQTPAAFFRAAAGTAAADALDMEVAVLLQLQQHARQWQEEEAAAPPPPPALVPLAAQHQQQLPTLAAVRLPAQQQWRQEEQPGRQEAKQLQQEEGLGAAQAAGPDMQPSTPRRNPGCLCAPGCPCALLDRCACCTAGSSDEEEEPGGQEVQHTHAGTCGAGSGKCCCCSGASSTVPGCAGCEAQRPAGATGTAQPATAPAAGGGCCGGGRSCAPAALPSCCAGK